MKCIFCEAEVSDDSCMCDDCKANWARQVAQEVTQVIINEVTQWLQENGFEEASKAASLYYERKEIVRRLNEKTRTH